MLFGVFFISFGEKQLGHVIVVRQLDLSDSTEWLIALILPYLSPVSPSHSHGHIFTADSLFPRVFSFGILLEGALLGVVMVGAGEDGPPVQDVHELVIVDGVHHRGLPVSLHQSSAIFRLLLIIYLNRCHQKD